MGRQLARRRRRGLPWVRPPARRRRTEAEARGLGVGRRTGEPGRPPAPPYWSSSLQALTAVTARRCRRCRGRCLVPCPAALHPRRRRTIVPPLGNAAGLLVLARASLERELSGAITMRGARNHDRMHVCCGCRRDEESVPAPHAVADLVMFRKETQFPLVSQPIRSTKRPPWTNSTHGGPPRLQPKQHRTARAPSTMSG